MCGLVGVLSRDMTAEKLSIFHDLMVVATLRGDLGAGVAAVPSQPGPVETLRDPVVCAAELASGSEFHKLFFAKKANKFNCVMGHARMPTRGGLDDKDCHPHSSRHVIGMHNGTMKSVCGRQLTKAENDSEALIAAIGTHGLKATLEQSEGDYAVTVYNKNESRLFFARSAKRPLHFAMLAEDPNTLFWASEAMMLHLVLSRSTVGKIKHFTLKPNHILGYRVYYPGVLEYETVAMVTPPETEVKAQSRTEVYQTTPNHFTSHDVLQALLHGGCSNCNEVQHLAEYLAPTITWFSPKEFICDTCLTHDAFARTFLVSHSVPVPARIKPVLPLTH